MPAPVDPLNGLPFADRVIPAARFSHDGPRLLTPLPLPNFGGPGGNYSATGISRVDPRELLVRFDYVVSPKTQINYRWVHDEWAILDAFQGERPRNRAGRAAAAGVCDGARDLAHLLAPAP